MSKASPQGSEARKEAEVANPCGDIILKGKEKPVGQRGQHFKPQKDGYQQPARSSRENGVETILVEQVTRRHGVPLMQEYLVRWKSLSRRKASLEREDALGKFVNLIRRFESEVLMG